VYDFLPMNRTPRRILVLDDDRDTASTFAELLKMMGHDAMFLTDPSKVDDSIDVLQPHIAFLDIGMPRLDGWRVAERIRTRYSAETLRLVAITAHGGEEERAKSRRAGFDAHLLKPASPDLVESILTQFFSPPG
jgi:CheY-like chemotaxis protein